MIWIIQVIAIKNRKLNKIEQVLKKVQEKSIKVILKNVFRMTKFLLYKYLI